MLAVSTPAEAKIVYTSAHQVVRCCKAVTLDLDHDGVADFQLRFAASDPHAMILNVRPMQSGNQIWGGGPLSSAFALPAGANVKSGWEFQPSHRLMAGYSTGSLSSSFGQWANVQNRYLGLKFFIKGKIHYGWARLSVKVKGFSITATLTGYAYETTANKGIVSGKTKGPDRPLPVSDSAQANQVSSLGLLATGYRGVEVWRNSNGGKP